MNATQDRIASDVAHDTVEAFTGSLPASTSRKSAQHVMAQQVVQVLDVIEALTVTSDLPRANAYTRADTQGALAVMNPLDRVTEIVKIAREVANFAIPTHYASTGGTRQAEANDLAGAVVTALFRAGLLAVTPVEIVKAILDKNYRRDTGTLAERIVALLDEPSNDYETAFGRVRNAIWMTYSGGTTAHSNAREVFDFLGRGNEIEAL